MIDPPPVLELKAIDVQTGEDRSVLFDGAPCMMHASLMDEDGKQGRDLIVHSYPLPAPATETDSIQHQNLRNLLGDVTVLGKTLYANTDDWSDLKPKRLLFVFSNLSIRAAEVYRLRFRLIDMSMPTLQWPDMVAYTLSSPECKQKPEGVDADVTNRSEASHSLQSQRSPYYFPGTNTERVISPGGTSPFVTTQMTVYTNPFTVYQPKHFPGLGDSTPLSRCLQAQGVRIPIRSVTPSLNALGNSNKVETKE